MNDVFTAVLDQLRSVLFWLPRWAAATIVIALVCAAALTLHALALRILRHSRAGNAQFTKLLIMRAANPTRLAIVLLALGAAVPASGLSSATQQQFIVPLTALFILLVGWSCMAAVGLVGDLYLDRFKTGFENALTRKHVTQVRLLRRAAQVMLGLITAGAAMMTLPAIRQYGVSLFASAGAAGIVVGLAARPLLSNLLAGIQIAITQPVKIEDSVVINNEWGWVEDITSTYLVVRTWDWRRLIVPLSWFLEQPIQNWTRETSTIIGQVHLNVDYRTPIDEVRQELDRLVHASKLWDSNVVNLQVVEATENTIQLRILATASDASRAWDLRCELREKMIAWLQREHPDCLPRHRLEVTSDDAGRSDMPVPERVRSFSSSRQ
jgi:small-conductance mechanosensitive channel